MIVAHRLAVGAFFLIVLTGHPGLPGKAQDLNPVAFKEKPNHPAITLVDNGKAKASIAVMGPRSK